MKKRWAFRVLIVFGSVFTGLLFCEIALRVIGYSQASLYTTDPDRGVALRPGAVGGWRGEAANYISINSDGLRDREHTKAKPPGTLRVAVLGDSYAEGLQVNVEYTFWAIMEQKMQECETFAGRKVEVINFGVSGYGTAQELITLRRRVWDYSPDIILLAFHTGNDISDNSRALKKREDVPYYVYQNDELVLDSAFLNSSQYRLRQSKLNRVIRFTREYSRLAQAIFEVYKTQAMANVVLAADDGEPKPVLYHAPSDQVWEDAWRVTERLIVLMRDEAVQHNAKFLVVTLSNGIQTHPDPATRAEYVKRWEISELCYPDLRVKDLGERAKFPVLNLAPHLQAYAEEHKTFVHGFTDNPGRGHWNKTGHRVAGEKIAQALCEGISD